MRLLYKFIYFQRIEERTRDSKITNISGPGPSVSEEGGCLVEC